MGKNWKHGELLEAGALKPRCLLKIMYVIYNVCEYIHVFYFCS